MPADSKTPEPARLTVAALARTHDALTRLIDQPLDFDTALKVTTAHAKTQPYHARYAAARVAAAQKHGTAAAHGTITIPVERMPRFNQDLALVGEEEADHDLFTERSRFSTARLAGVTITPNELLALGPLLLVTPSELRA
jgi:hypothetical protein